MRRLMSSAMLLRAVQAAALNTLIALGITVFGQESFGTNLVYSQCIGLSILGLIDFGRQALIRDWPTQWRRLVLIVPLGASAGFLLGTLLADALLGHSSSQYWLTQPRKAIGFLVLSLVAGTVLTYYFMSREQLAAERQKLEIARRQAVEARLKLLETQLEPHMLFNTLANLRALITTDPPRATAMLDRMIAYLRATLSASRQGTHPLAAEFERLHDYLELMAVRMGPRLHYTLDLPPELAACPVPALLLQPLVENSIQHGLEPKVEGGRITVQARRDGALLVLEVRDTGIGLAASQGTAGGTGFGLAQVRERLATEYGTQAALDFVADTAGGTRATITFPCQT